MHHYCAFFSTQWFAEQLQKHDYTLAQDVCHDQVMLQSANQMVGLNYGRDQREIILCLCEIALNKLLNRQKGGLYIPYTHISVVVHTVMNS